MIISACRRKMDFHRLKRHKKYGKILRCVCTLEEMPKATKSPRFSGNTEWSESLRESVTVKRIIAWWKQRLAQVITSSYVFHSQTAQVPFCS